MRQLHGPYFSSSENEIKLSLDLNSVGVIKKIGKDLSEEEKE